MSTLLTYLGLLLVAGVALQVGIQVWSAFSRVAFETRERDLFLKEWDEKVVAAEATTRRVVADAGARWSGYRKFVVRRKQVEDEAEQICSFYLSPHDEKPLPSFLPGQHLVFDLHVDDKRQVRCYSLSDAPDPDYYRVSIKRVPGGCVSNHFHDHIKEGDLLDLKAPGGEFYINLDEDTGVVLVAGGVGITPCYSMLKTIVERGANREVWFMYAVRSLSEIVAHQELNTLAHQYDSIHVHFFVSDKEAELPGENYHRGHLSADYMRELLPSNNYKFYMCGPPPMMDAVKNGLKEWGVPVPGELSPDSSNPRNRVLWEHFGPPPSAPVPAAAAAVHCKITFARSGKTLDWDPAAGNLLKFAHDHGIAIDAGCRIGNCGSCMTAVKSGSVSYNGEPGCEDLQDGCCLTCVGFPDSDVELDA